MASHKKDTLSKTFVVALLLCVVCSVLVSSAAVFLREKQNANKALDMKKNILIAAGISTDNVEAGFRRIKTQKLDLQSGELEGAVDPTKIDLRKMAKDPTQNLMLNSQQDIAGIKSIAQKSLVYLVNDEDGTLQKYILPIHGKGLWSTLYGFLAMDKTFSQIEALTFYEHGETPGLGGEVDNPRWKKIWEGKLPFDELGNPIVRVIKGRVDPQAQDASHQIDGLSGATLTSNGVEHLVNFWLGQNGYGKFIQKMRGSAL